MRGALQVLRELHGRGELLAAEAAEAGLLLELHGTLVRLSGAVLPELLLARTLELAEAARERQPLRGGVAVDVLHELALLLLLRLRCLFYCHRRRSLFLMPTPSAALGSTFLCLKVFFLLGHRRL